MDVLYGHPRVEENPHRLSLWVTKHRRPVILSPYVPLEAEGLNPSVYLPSGTPQHFRYLGRRHPAHQFSESLVLCPRPHHRPHTFLAAHALPSPCEP